MNNLLTYLTRIPHSIPPNMRRNSLQQAQIHLMIEIIIQTHDLSI